MSITFNIREMDEMIDNMRFSVNSALPRRLANEAENVVRIIISETRKYIPAKHRLAQGQGAPSTGRLWSSFGVPNKRTDNPEYDPNDAFYEVRQGGDNLNIEIEVGTEVEYAGWANYGTGNNYASPYFFLEKGEFDSKEIVGNFLEEAIEDELQAATTAGRRFRAARQVRDVKGRFGRVLRLDD